MAKDLFLRTKLGDFFIIVLLIWFIIIRKKLSLFSYHFSFYNWTKSIENNIYFYLDWFHWNRTRYQIKYRQLYMYWIYAKKTGDSGPWPLAEGYNIQWMPNHCKFQLHTLKNKKQTPLRLWPLTCDFELTSRSKNVIRCRLLYCTLVPGMMSVSVIVWEILSIAINSFLWPLTFAWDNQRLSRPFSL